MGYTRIGGFPRKFSVMIQKKDFLSKSGDVFAGDLKIKGKLIIEGNYRTLTIDEGSFRTKGGVE